MPSGSFSLGRVEIDGAPVSVAVIADQHTAVRLDTTLGTTTDALIANWDGLRSDLFAVVDAYESGTLDDEHLLGLKDRPILIPFTVSRLMQSGMNYTKHVVDLAVAAARRAKPHADLETLRAEATERMSERAANGEPFIFSGVVEAMCGADDDVVLPAIGSEHDWELELGVVIGTPGHHIQRDSALDHVAGYVTVNDITTRDLVFRRGADAVGADWFRSKNAPTFFPTGPWLVPSEFVPDPMCLTIRLSHNGDVMQNESTADMIFDVARLIEHSSATVPLLAGDLLLTGSPAGNGAHWGRVLRAGDVMESVILAPDLVGPGFGTQHNRCVAEVAT